MRAKSCTLPDLAGEKAFGRAKVLDSVADNYNRNIPPITNQPAKGGERKTRELPVAIENQLVTKLQLNGKDATIRRVTRRFSHAYQSQHFLNDYPGITF